MSAMTNEKPVRKGVRQLYELSESGRFLEEVENELRRCVDAHAQLIDYMRQTKPRNKKVADTLRLKAMLDDKEANE